MAAVLCAWGLQVGAAIKYTVLHSFMAAFALPGYVGKAMSFIDSAWAIAVDRADKAGAALADTLMVRRLRQ